MSSLRRVLSGASVLAASALLAGANAWADGVGGRIGATASGTAQESRMVDSLPTATPIKHVVVIFDENVSFDHYFATYPDAANPPGEPPFTPAPNMPAVNNLKTAGLLIHNPNAANPANGAGAVDPFRLDRTEAATADQNHSYTPEQQAYDGGKMDLFPRYTGMGTPGAAGAFGTTGQVMGYFDGNTVTALWHYADHFAMDDNAWTNTYGPSTPGALEVVSGQTDGVKLIKSAKSNYYIPDGQGGLALIADVDPAGDVCSKPANAVLMEGRNIGDLLNAAKIPWGGFMGGFNLNVTNPNGTTGCARSTTSRYTGTVADYIPHHNWFQYYPSTANPAHARPAALADIGYSFDADGKPDPANHEYGLQDFTAAVKAGDFPAVSYIKLPAYQDGHAGYSDPLDEQEGIVKLVNFLESLPDWKNTAIILTWDDSDGWYDHAFIPPTNPSFNAAADRLDGAGKCGTGTPMRGVASDKPVNGRCGPGTRIPFLVISPWAKPNDVDHARISQASVVRFIEDNWLGGKRLGGGSFDASAGSLMQMFDFKGQGSTPPLVLDPGTGEQTAS